MDALQHELAAAFPGLVDGSEVNGADLVDWLSGRFARLPLAKPRVLIVVADGVGDYVVDEAVDVVMFDWDNYRAGDPSEVPAHFADLAACCAVPLAASVAEAP
ncbi:hypothetical protein [Chitinimonas koreensis]|uniref:hypothetical protein n=1 Tax=Chitinimonas koreensis TaxID=356302 RepID=UPI000420C8EC|nr:hypothetical protein [Chitinimonas koreensis]QNM95499.1 hypothetical protein H9L41_16735 [Chitinimonas koreensis]